MRHVRLTTLVIMIMSIFAGAAFAANPQASAAAKGAKPPILPPPPPGARAHSYGVVGQGATWDTLDPDLLQAQYNAGIRVRMVEANWKDLQPTSSSDWAANVAQNLQGRLDALIATGADTQLVLDLGVQYPPAWAASIDPLTDQFGHVWQASNLNGGGANLYWSPTVRAAAATYVQRLFANLNFRGRLWAVRVGNFGGELLYPDQRYAGFSDSFWAFDATAQAGSPVPGWRPGQASPNGEAQRFYAWYVNNLDNYFRFMMAQIRPHFAGYIAPVTPGQGLWDATVNQLVSRNLVDLTQQHTGTGNYWQHLFAILPSGAQGVLNWCSSVGDISGSDDGSANWYEWSAAKQLAYLAHLHGRAIFGENPGHNAYDTAAGADPRTTMQWDMATITNSGYLGLIWIRQSDMTAAGNATLAQFAAQIAAHP